MSCKFLPLAAFLLVIPASISTAQTQRTLLRQCGSVDLKVAVEACTKFIDSQAGHGIDLAFAYSHRGYAKLMFRDDDAAIKDFTSLIDMKVDSPDAFTYRGQAYFRTGEYDRALADYDQAIRLRSNSPVTFNNRGVVYRVRGDYDRAIEDFNEALRLNSKDAGALNNLGFIKFSRGQFADAAENFMAATRTSPKNLLNDLRLYVSRARAGQNDTNELSRGAGRYDVSKWPGAVIELYLGRMATDKVRAAADVGDTKVLVGQVCQAKFYIGEYELIHGNTAQAKQYFQDVVDTCSHALSEYDAAVFELKQ
jgi:lipoprotein NlpI